MWKPIEGYRYPYRINEEGTVQRKLPTGEWKTMEHTVHRNQAGRGYAAVNLAVFPQGHRAVTLAALMEGRFLPVRKPGERYWHKSGSALDWSAKSIEVVSQAEFARRQGGPGRKIVAKVDRNGDMVEIYRSIQAAARSNFMDAKSVTNRCLGRIKDPFAATGYTFRYAR